MMKFLKNLKEEFLYLFSKSDIEKVKMPIIKLAVSPFALLIDNFKKLFWPSIIFAFILTVISIVLGQALACGYDYELKNEIFCPNSNLLFLSNVFLRLLVFSTFMIKYSDLAWRNIEFNFSFDMRILKTFLFNAIVIILHSTPFISLYLLMIRVPNPDFRIELVYFAAVSIGFILPIFLIRFYSIYGFIFNNEVVPPMMFIWKRTSSNTLVILLGLFLMFVLAVFVIMNLQSMFTKDPRGNILYIYFVSEFIYNIVVLWLLTLFVNHCQKQREFLDVEGEKND